MRSPAGTGFCCDMISFTLETAVGVKLTGNFGVVSTSGVVVEAIFLFSLKAEPIFKNPLLYIIQRLYQWSFASLDACLPHRVAGFSLMRQVVTTREKCCLCG